MGLAPAVVLGLVTSVCWTAANVFIQRSSRTLGVPRALVWALFTGGALSLAGAAALEPAPRVLDPSLLAWTGGAAVAGLVAYGSLFRAFEAGSFSLTVPITSSWCLVSAGVSLAAFGERVPALHLAGAGLVAAGVLLVSFAGPAGGGPPISRTATRPRDALLAAFAAALGFGLMMPGLAQATRIAGPLWAMALVYGMIGVLAVPLAALRAVSLRPPPPSLWLMLAAVGGLEALGTFFVAMATRHAAVAVVAPLASLSSLLTVVYGWMFLEERPGLVVRVGALVACAGVVILSL